MDKESVFHFLNYTHNELQALLYKLENSCTLTPEQYDQLFEEIGLDNISTFTGDYDDLINKPEIPLRLSSLMNDVGFITEKNVIYEINDELIPIREQLEQLDIIVSALNKLDLEMVSDDLAHIQDNVNFLSKMVEELRSLNNSLSTQLDSTKSDVKELNNDIELLISEQNYISDEIKNVKANVRTINETKLELIKTTDYLKNTMVGENEYEFEKSIVDILKETRGEDFTTNTRSLDAVSKILETLIGVGDGIEENTFGVLMQNINGLPELICVRDYIYKIDSLYEQLGKEGLLAFIDQFRTILDALERDNEALMKDNERLHERINELERLHIQDKEKLDKTLQEHAIAIQSLEATLKTYNVDNLSVMISQASREATRAYEYASSNDNKIKTLNSKVTSNTDEIALIHNRIEQIINNNNNNNNGGGVEIDPEINAKIQSLISSVDGLTNNVNRLTDNVDNLTDDITGLTGDVSRLSSNVSNVSSNMTTLSNNMSDLTSDMNDLTSDMSNLTNDVNVLAGEVGTYTNNVNSLTSNINSLSSNVTNLSSSVNSLSSNVSGLTSNVNTLSGRVTTLENSSSDGSGNYSGPQHIFVTEKEYYNNYTEAQRNSQDMLFIITDYNDSSKPDVPEI